MSDKLKESLSAVIDSEADEFELRRVLDEIGKNIELRETWDRYHLVSSVIRGDRKVVGTSDRMRARVWAAYQAETTEPVAETATEAPDATPQPPEPRPNWIGRSVGIAVAATP